MLRFYKGDNLEQLAGSLLKELRSHPLPNPLSPERFIVQNHGMARWLSLHIAEKETVAANLQFNFPAELFWETIRLVKPGIPEKLPSERLPMTWAIFQILKAETDSTLSVLHDYIKKDDPQKEEMRCWNLACRIGDVFDQYLTYRPEMVLAWENENCRTDIHAERWQAHLWQKLVYYWQSGDTKEWNHRARLGQQLIASFNEPSIWAGQLPSRISIFGVSEMPPVYLRSFIKMSKCTDVHFYLSRCVDCKNNRLGDSLGRAGSEFAELIEQFVEEDAQISVDVINAERVSSNKENVRLLDTLKQDLLSKNKPNSLITNDSTLQIHSCHSARREVEILYDQLLRLLDENKGLDPSDILVLSPQMEDYAPEIDAVFGAVEKQMPQIPFYLAESAVQSPVVYSGFLKLLNLIDSRFKLTDVLDLLDCKPICQTYSFSEDDINMLETWIGDTGIRWGIDAMQKGAFGLPKLNSYTWESGLHQMLAGYAMEKQEDLLFDGIYPYTEIQQSEQARLLGRFSLLLHHLFQCQQQILKTKKPAQWSMLLRKWVSQFFTKQSPHIRHIQGIHEIINTFSRQLSQANFSDKLSFPVLYSYLHDQIAQKSKGGGRAGQGVMFSSLIPMRNIPAKVVCMIGMNDGVFPRSKSTMEFDLITQRHQIGDRIPGRDDRQIFLECMLAAQQYIYFSYVGQSNRKDVKFPPSILLKELLDYIEDKYKINEDELIQVHRLQEFSPSYFENDDTDLFSYSILNRDVARRLSQPDSHNEELFLDEALPEPSESLKILSVGELTQFFQHPVKFLFQQRLGIYFNDDEVLNNDREVFQLNGLEKYNLKQELLDRFLDERSMDSYQKVAYARNLLPDGWSGKHAFGLQEDKAREFGGLVKEIRSDQDKLDPVQVNYQWGEFHLSGSVNQVYSREQLFYRFGRIRSKDLIELWIKHLALQTANPMDHPLQSRLIGINKYKKLTQIVLPPVPNAPAILQELLELYWVGLQKVTYFFPDTSYAYARAFIEKDQTHEEALKKAQKAWKDPGQNYRKEGDNLYNKRLMNNINYLIDKELVDIFKHVSISFWQPFFTAYTKR